MSRDRKWLLEEELRSAAAGGDEEKVAELLRQGVDVNCGISGNKPLHSAASVGHVRVAELLLKAGAQVDSRNMVGDTPLHSAASGGHVGVAELLLKAGGQMDSRNKRGVTPEDIAASTEVPFWHRRDKNRILEGRKRVLELFAAEKADRPYMHKLKVGPEGGKLQTAYCTVSVPPEAVTMETEITCQVIYPNDVTLPLKGGEMLVSDVIELGPHGTTFRKPVTVQMQYNGKSLDGATEAVVWTTEDMSQWTELKTAKESEDELSVSVDHFSIFAVISQPKQDKLTVPTEGFKLTSSTQPAVQISFPEQAVDTETPVSIQVQEVPKRAVEDIKAKDESFVNLVGTSPIVNVETVSTSEVQFHKPVTVRVPHPQHYMDIQHEGPTKLRVMSCEEGTEDWMDVTDNVTISRVTEEVVEFEVTHLTSWIVVLVKDNVGTTETLGLIPLKVCQWLQLRPVQFILLQREITECVVECTTGNAEERRYRLMKEGYEVPLPSGTVHLFEGQQVEIRIQGNVAPFGMENKREQQMTFHSQNYNRLHMQVVALKDVQHKGLDGRGCAKIYALPRVEVERQKVESDISRLKRSARKARGQREPESTFICQLPIRVPYGSPEETSAGALRAAFKDVGKTFYFIKENVSSDWQDLAFHLGFERADIDNIAGRNRDDKSRCMDMLQEWKKKKGDAATIEVLMEALSEAKLQSVVDGLKREYSIKVARYGKTPPARGEDASCPP